MEILDRLGSGKGMPIEVIRAATADRAAVAPLLLDAIDRCEPKGEIEMNGLFIAFHLLAQWREKSASAGSLPASARGLPNSGRRCVGDRSPGHG